MPFEIDCIATGNETRGHRFMAPKPFAVKNFADYAEKLRKAYVMLDAGERAKLILEGARKLAKKEKLDLVEDEALLAENAGLTEWPVPLIGSFDESFLEVPAEVLSTSMKAHQKCFSLKRGRSLANRFILIANLEAEDGGKSIVAGNERVIAARLSDAKFFYDQDRDIGLEIWVPKLKDVVFHEKLGTQYDRVHRVWPLARELAPLVGADPDLAERAAIVAKADLVSGMVGEFPELQGVMGRYYALDQQEDPLVADAIAAHYKPVGPSDEVPREPIAIAVALADKLDMLTGFWSIDEKPTGSKDPYALRRAALGIIRIVLENGIRLPLLKQRSGKDQRLPPTCSPFSPTGSKSSARARRTARSDRRRVLASRAGRSLDDRCTRQCAGEIPRHRGRRQSSHRHQARHQYSPHRGEEGRKSYDQAPDAKLLELKEEKTLAKAVDEVEHAAAAAISKEDFEAAMAAMAKLRKPVDAFFDNVTVNVDDAKLRTNRLRLLNRIRATTYTVADFSKIEG